MKNKKMIIKYVLAIVTIFIMSFLIFFVYDYYMKKALDKKNTSDNSTTNTNANETSNNEGKKEKELVFLEFDGIKKIISVDGSAISITSSETDAGYILLVGNNSVLAYNLKDKVEYAVLDDIVVFKTTNDYEGIKIYFVSKDGNVLKEYQPDLGPKYNLLISEPLLSDNYKDPIIYKDYKFIITWVVNHDDNYSILLNNDETLKINSNIFLQSYKTDEVIEYSIEFEYLGNNRFTESKKLEEFILLNYVEKYKE